MITLYALAGAALVACLAYALWRAREAGKAHEKAAQARRDAKTRDRINDEVAGSANDSFADRLRSAID